MTDPVADARGRATSTAYRPSLARTWFLRNPSFRLYALRELTSVGLSVVALDLAAGAICLGLGAEAWKVWTDLQHSPLGLALLVMGLASCLFHAATWFSVSSKLLPAPVSRRVSRSTFATMQWVVTLCIAATLLAVALVLGGGR
ncbi:MAG: hypothetical protein EA397_08950 [Deltaproteobacteria bacterium]|nr:MAG: hypothetical protein EA397_08950 [Deltaproteobacteria bacterium]